MATSGAFNTMERESKAQLVAVPCWSCLSCCTISVSHVDLEVCLGGEKAAARQLGKVKPHAFQDHLSALSVAFRDAVDF